MDTKRALEVALKPLNDVDLQSTIAEIKFNALASSDWEQFVASAPVALRCLGACHVASNSRDLSRVNAPVMPGAQIQRPSSLQSSLIRCAFLGTEAFLMLHKNMTGLRQYAHASEEKSYDLLDVLCSSPRQAAKVLPSLLSNIQEGTKQCYEMSKEMDDRLSEWLALTVELLQACQSQSAAVADAQQKAVEDRAVAARQVKDMSQTSRDAVSGLARSMDAALAAYERASENQPTGWEIIGQHIVSSLGQCLTTSSSQAITTLVDASSPMAKVADSTQVLAYLQKDLYLYSLLKSILQGTDGNVDWAAAKPSGDNRNSGLTFIESMLSHSKDSLNRQNFNGTVSTTYKQIIDDVNKVVGEMIKAANDYNPPQRSSELVTRWQTSFDSSYRSVLSMDVQARSLLFNATSTSPSIPDANLDRPIVNGESKQTQAILQHAANQLEATASTLETTKKVYGQTHQLLSEKQTDLSNINERLTQLTSGEIGLEEVKEILTICVAFAVEFKSTMSNMVAFSSAITTVLKTLRDNLVANWLETVKNPGATSKIGQYSLEAAKRSMILNVLVTTTGCLSFITDFANTWRSLSERSIFPGIELAESISRRGGDESATRGLEIWSRQAQEYIKSQRVERQRDLDENMQQRVEKIRDLIRDLDRNAASGNVVETIRKTAGEIERARNEAFRQECDKSVIKLVAARRK